MRIKAGKIVHMTSTHKRPFSQTSQLFVPLLPKPLQRRKIAQSGTKSCERSTTISLNEEVMHRPGWVSLQSR